MSSRGRAGGSGDHAVAGASPEHNAAGRGNEQKNGKNLPRLATRAGRRSVPVRRLGPAGLESGDDWVTVEEPLELRVRGVACATLMRTPGDDRSLALGFFFTEGWISSLSDVGAVALCARGREGGEENVADMIPAEGVEVRPPSPLPRIGLAVSSCGVCGKRTIEDVLALSPFRPGAGARKLEDPRTPLVSRAAILAMPGRLRTSQRLFTATGALHAAGVFDSSGNLQAIREDVGRHNAVDKVAGWALAEGRLPLAGHVLFVSGRVSFEIAQKAYRAGIPVVAAVSGVSSLAVDLAERAGITLCGFVRGDVLTVYTHPERIADENFQWTRT